ncbi:uncharacterized protein LOC123293655 [Chrysoperla carnea]|uniref:uncharacterized protein LOC123293655 n=1 Tax=Chrysoperla carnea TaxID=189513 RepID=UPI001D08D787|nr:uncharacterized protein LOC123293655 [Chrysoperla carnea]
MSYRSIIRCFSLHKILSQRQPGITFRAGKHSTPPSKGGAAAPSPLPKSAAPSTKVVQAGPVIEDYMLPARYRRALISEDEIEYINRGGPA